MQNVKNGQKIEESKVQATEMRDEEITFMSDFTKGGEDGKVRRFGSVRRRSKTERVKVRVRKR